VRLVTRAANSLSLGIKMTDDPYLAD
jgi:hypothetical protein